VSHALATAQKQYNWLKMESKRAARAAQTFFHVFAKLCENSEKKVTVLAPTQTDN